MKSGAKSLYRSLHKAVTIPALVTDILNGYLKGQMRLHMDLHASPRLGTSFAAADSQSGHGHLGYGAAHWLQYPLYHRYAAQNLGDPSHWRHGLSHGVCHCHVCIFKETFFQKKIKCIPARTGLCRRAVGVSNIIKISIGDRYGTVIFIR